MSKKKITFANSFAKDLKKLPNSLANDHKIDVLRKQLLKKMNIYHIGVKH